MAARLLLRRGWLIATEVGRGGLGFVSQQNGVRAGGFVPLWRGQLRQVRRMTDYTEWSETVDERTPGIVLDLFIVSCFVPLGLYFRRVDAEKDAELKRASSELDEMIKIEAYLKVMTHFKERLLQQIVLHHEMIEIEAYLTEMTCFKEHLLQQIIQHERASNEEKSH